MTTPTCNCKQMSCPKDCVRIHTHKGFFCEVCEPVEAEWEKEAERLYFQQGISIDDWLNFVRSLLKQRDAELVARLKSVKIDEYEKDLNLTEKENRLCKSIWQQHNNTLQDLLAYLKKRG